MTTFNILRFGVFTARNLQQDYEHRMTSVYLSRLVSPKLASSSLGGGKNWRTFIHVLSLSALLVCSFLLCCGIAIAQEQSDIPSKSLSDYPAAGIRAGIWNDGQAALWDLHIIDYFRYSGPEQRARGYRPEQPINFSHIVHVQQNKMECQYCHWNVTKSGYAAIPDVETCIGCHGGQSGALGVTPQALNAKGKKQSAEEVQKLMDFYKKGEPIPWRKVHVMPDHYKFNHKRHVKGGVACHECHGQVAEMPVVERVSSMKMGWCISCHRERGTSIDCATCHY